MDNHFTTELTIPPRRNLLPFSDIQIINIPKNISTNTTPIIDKITKLNNLIDKTGQIYDNIDTNSDWSIFNLLKWSIISPISTLILIGLAIRILIASLKRVCCLK